MEYIHHQYYYHHRHHHVCLTTGPKRVLRRVKYSASFLNFQYLLVSRSFSSCLCLLPCLPITYILPSIFPSIMCFRRQFLRNMQLIQLAFLLFIVCRIFLSSLTPCNNSSFLTRSVQLIFSNLFQCHISRLSRYF